MIKNYLEEAKKEFKEVEEEFKKEISKFRTGRASVSILDGIMINYFGTLTPLNQLASLGVPQADLITIQPWDSKIIADIEKAIRASNLGLNPFSDGKVIKIKIPPMDQQRRQELIKTLKKYSEERKTIIRNLRRDYREKGKILKDNKEISEDDEKRYYDDLQKEVDRAIENLDKLIAQKEKQILED